MPTGVYKRKPLSDETKRKIGIANSIALKGRKLPEEVKIKIGLAGLGRKHPPRTKEWLRKQRLAKCGKKNSPHTEATKQKIKEALLKNGHRPPVNKGKDCHWWKGGVTPVNEAIRKSLEYKIWRKKVFERDKYKCKSCGILGGEIEADHIKPFALYPELRFCLSNGRTLCKICHRKTDTFGSKTNLCK